MTPTQRQAMEQALEALEHHTAIKHPQQRHYRDAAIEALRAALAETAEPVAWQKVLPGGRMTDQWDSCRIADYNEGWNDYRKAAKAALEKVTAPQPPAPAAGTPLAQFVNSDRTTLGEQAARQAVQMQQAAVELTDEEIGAAVGFNEHTNASTKFALVAIARAAIAAHEAKKGKK